MISLRDKNQTATTLLPKDSAAQLMFLAYQNTLDRPAEDLYNPVSALDSANGNANTITSLMPNRITMTDVAHAAGVSLMTVSRVVNEKEDVSSETRQRVLDVIHKLGYRPSSIARGLATRRTGTLGLVVPDIDNPFFSGIVRGAENQAYAEGYSVFLCNTNEDPQRELAVLQSLEDHFIDGLMLCSSRLEPDTLREAVSHFPTVVLVSRQIDEACTGTLLIDDEMGGRLAAEHLLQAGHTKIGFISGPQVSHSGKWRLKGYCSALQDSGIGIKDGWITYCAPVVEEGRRATLKLLENYPELTAVICHNDLVAVGAIHACSELSRILPNQLALIGFDDIPMASVVTPALTTCRVPREELGTQAMGLLLRQIEDCQDRDIKNILIRPELIVRASAP